MGEQYTICDPRMAAGYAADEKAKLLSARRTQNHGSILYSAFSTKSFSTLPVAAVGPVAGHPPIGVVRGHSRSRR